MSIITTIFTVVAKEIAVEVISFVKVEFAELKKDFMQYQELKKEFQERDLEVLELKNDIKLANTPEERDALLDKMDSLLRSSFK